MNDSADTALPQLSWVDTISAITVFTENLMETKTFYLNVFGLPLYYQDENSAVFKFGATLINLLDVKQAPELIHPAAAAPPNTGSRLVLTLTVPDVDLMCIELQRRGVTLLNGPVNRPWGIRTASFLDPAGQIWEIAH